jgi:zinc protease
LGDFSGPGPILRKALFAALALLSVPSLAETRFGEESFTLKNGLQVIVVPNHRAPTVTQFVWYKVGAADEERGRSGSAHFLEHLMFRGTKTVKPKEFSEQIARIGGEENAFTSWDYTAFFQVVAADRLELVMRLEADRMHNLVINDEQLLPERNVVLEEWGMRTGNQPSSLLEEQIDAALYLNHPYRIPVLGWKNEIQTLDVPTERRFYETWYAPNNAVLIVAGDVTTEQVKALAEKYYGAVPSHPVPPRHRLEEPARSADALITLKDHRVRQPIWSREYLAPSYRTAGDDRPYALEVLADVLGGGAASRLHRALVLDQSLATGAGAWYEASRYDLGRVMLQVNARPDIGLDQLGDAATKVLETALKDGITADEVERAKKRLITGALYEEDSLRQPAEIIGRGLTTGQTLEDVDRWPAKIAAVSVDAVNKVAKEVFQGKTSVTGYLLPAQGGAISPEEVAAPTSGEIR